MAKADKHDKLDKIYDVVSRICMCGSMSHYAEPYYRSIREVLGEVRPMRQDYYALTADIKKYCTEHATTLEALRKEYCDKAPYKLTQIGYKVYIHAQYDTILKIMHDTLHRMKQRYDDKNGERTYQIIKTAYFDVSKAKRMKIEKDSCGETWYIVNGERMLARSYRRWKKDALERYSKVFFGAPNGEAEMNILIATEAAITYFKNEHEESQRALLRRE